MFGMFDRTVSWIYKAYKFDKSGEVHCNFKYTYFRNTLLFCIPYRSLCSVQTQVYCCKAIHTAQ